MEFSSIWYSSFWSLISIAFSTIGIYALHKATIPGSVILELCFVQSVSSSISYAFLFRPALEELDLEELQDEPSNKIFLNFFSDSCLRFLPLITLLFALPHRWNTVPGICWLVSVALTSPYAVKSIILCFRYSRTIGNFFTGFAGPLRMYPYYTLSWVLLQGLLWWLFLLPRGFPATWDSLTNILSPSLLWPTTFILACPLLKKLAAPSSAAACVYQQRRFIEIVCGMLANTLAQYYFRVQSLPLMLVSLSLAMAWLGNLANVQPRTDFGIFQFLVTMSAQTAVSLYGLHFYTLLVVLAGIAMMVLRWKIESVSLKHFGKQESVVRDWRRLEELYGEQPETTVAATSVAAATVV